MYTVGLYTLGCKVSQYETEAVAEKFACLGFEVKPFTELCDVYVINTCTVTAESDRKSRQIIRRAIALNPAAIVCVMGCYSQRSPKEVTAIKGVSLVIGTQDKMSLPDRVVELLSGRTVDKCHVGSLEGVSFEPMHIEHAPRTRAYVKIEDGCECKCTYCAISGARGPVRSKPRNEVISEVEALHSSGVAEIVLTGIETGSYGKDFEEDYGLAELILELDRRHSCDRLRLGSLAPELVGKSFAEKVSGAKILAPHFHLSMQSGSDKILRQMKRRYSSATAMENIDRLREKIPGCEFTTDIMVGFPGESEKDFEDTLDFMRKAEFIDAHIFAYSEREGTPAAYYEDKVPVEVRKRRLRYALSVRDELRDRSLERIVERGEPLVCIAETRENGVYTSHSDCFATVLFEEEDGFQGKRVLIHPVSQKDGVIYEIGRAHV